MELNIDENLAPKLRLLFAWLSSSTKPHGGRDLRIFDTQKEVSADFLHAAIAELAHPEVAGSIFPDQLVALARLAWVHDSQAGTSGTLVTPLQRLLKSRWRELGTEVIRHAIKWDLRRELFAALPQLARATELVDVLAEADDHDLMLIERDIDFGSVPLRKAQLRRVLPALDGSNGRVLRMLLLIAAARQEGWTAWLKLFGILWHLPELASSDAPPLRFERDLPGADEKLQELNRELRSTLYGDAEARRVAMLVRDLKGPLASSPPDLREVYVRRLRSAVGDDAGLRQGAIEALLWTGKHDSRPIAVFAAIHLACPEDIPAVQELTETSERRVQYSAGVVLSALQGSTPDARALGLPIIPVGAGAALPHPLPQHTTAQPKTWLGSRLLEQMIEAAVSALEQEVAHQYARHHGSGEERLGERFFAILGDRLQMLEGALRQTAQALGDAPNASVLVRYRPVDKAEEGTEGIVGPGDPEPVPNFAADFCLVVNAYLDGEPLTRRAVLVQSKRLYPTDREDVSKGWVHSFRLDPVQTRSLLNQTTSSFYLFQGPADLQLGVGIIPAQLVEDLAQKQKDTGTVISARSVADASETFAEWFTYQLVALRTGDPLHALIEKAERGPGSQPYPLLRCGTVEIDVRVGLPGKKDG